MSIGVTVRDVAGNQSVLALKYSSSAAVATPRIRLDSPAADAKGAMQNGDLVSGVATGNAGPVSARVRIDGGETLVFPTGAFAFALSGLQAGTHTLSIEAGEAGRGLSRLTKELKIVGPGPTAGDFRVSDGKTAAPWTPGGDFVLGPSSALTGIVTAPNGLGVVTVTLNSGSPLQASLGKAAGGKVTFSAPLPATLPFDRVSVEVRAKDQAGLEGVEKLELHRVLPPADDERRRRRNPLRRRAHQRCRRDDQLPPVPWRQAGRPVQRQAHQDRLHRSVVPCPRRFLRRHRGRASRPRPPERLASATLSVVTVDGDSFSWGPFSAAVGASPPALELSAPSDGDWASGDVKVAGKASDPSAISSCRFR